MNMKPETRSKLKASEIKGYREYLLNRNNGLCKLCGMPIEDGQAVLDHCHSSGHVRGTLHRSCNALLGKIENNYKRMGMPFEQALAFAGGVKEYLTAAYSNEPLHPTHRTEEEKRLRRNAKAKAKRDALKKAKELA